MGRLFGTDGARGVANTELTCELAIAIGRAAAAVLTEETHHRPYILIGKDTRISSDMLEAALTAGICSIGADAVPLGVVPTPAVACLVRRYKADAGIMISASHNPVEYNGIKIFNGEGYKLPDRIEEKIEAAVLDKNPAGKTAAPPKTGGDIGRVLPIPSAESDYIEYLKSTAGGSLSGLRIAVDCANGSASATAKKLFSALGADVEVINASPDGININAGCGSTHIGMLSGYVRQNSFDIGVAFDGDADRCIAVDETGGVIDGDKLLAIFAADLKASGKLKNNTVAVTILSNLGLFKFCEGAGIKMSATKVGDRYVLEEMLKNGYVIGGEQSGHIIFLDHATTGDGQLSALQLLRILKNSGKKASELAAIMTTYPQVSVNVKVEPEAKKRFSSDARISKAVAEAETSLGGEGRVIVRPSGTEPLIRVMVEGKDSSVIKGIADGVAAVIAQSLGNTAI